ncbi:zinc finger CCCH domain-containing protein 55-like isoform X2 [Lolium rigidum]|uniref:zinc finger CCCH domain-containing protein 55-like isoform X2 n=1 Tax=Lolium rigidum TaxID=89674 RepID=UPI001F5C68F0|nr:zinc finger CCCH domain-containing protein 55-like isoform X2 [Lolium rigidum]
MSGVARKGRSKWDTKEVSRDVVEISEDDSPPKNTDDRRKDGGLHPSGESSNLKPDAFMQQGSSAHEKERTDGFNKDIKERQSKVSSERWEPPRVADEEHNNNDWGKVALEKATGNQGISKYADDRRRGDAWGTAVGRGYSSRLSSGPDAWRQRTRSPSPRGTEVAPEAGAESEVEAEAEVEVLILTVDLIVGLREAEYLEGLLCSAEILQLVDAEEACNAGFLMKMAGAGSSMSIILQTQGKGMVIRTRISWIHENQMTFHGAGNPEVIMRMVLGKDLNPEEITGPLSNAMSLSKEGAAEVQVADMFMMIPLLMLDGEMRLGKLLMVEHRRENRRPCKFFAEGRCRRGEICPYLHEEAPQSQMGPSASDEPPKYGDGRTTEGNYSNWGEQSNAAHVGSHILPRDDRENLGSQGTTVRSDTGYVYKNRQLEDAGRSQYQISPQEDFGPQGQNKPEIAALKRPQFSGSMQASADTLNNEKLSAMDGQSASANTGNLSVQTGIHAANLLGGQNLSQIAQNQDAVPQIAGAPTHPVNSQQDAASILPFNNQLHESNFSLHPNRQDQFVASQATANNSGPGMHNQPVPPYMGQNLHGYSQTSQALPDLSMFNGHNFSASGQVSQNSLMPLHAGQSQANIDMSKPSQDSGTQSLQSTHNFRPGAPNMQIQNQTLQGLSGVPSHDNGTQSMQNTHNFQPVAPYMQSQSHTLQGLSVLPSSSSADMPGAPLPRNAATSEEDLRRAVITSLAQSLIMQPGTNGLQLPQPNLNPNLMIGSSGAAVDAQPNPWPWAQQQAGMVQLTHSIPSEQQVPQTLQAPMAAGISNGNPVLLPQTVVPTGHAATTVANETAVPSENKKGEPKDTDGEAPEDGDSKKNKESKALKMFKLALADFVKEALKPTWKEGNLTREVHKTIVKKVVDKVTSTVENTPQSKEKIDVYMSYSKEKLSKLVQAYVGKYVKTS